MIVFDPTTWTIGIPPGESPIARQYDNLTRSIIVTGAPKDWDWVLLVESAGNLDIIDLSEMEGGIGVVLSAQMLALEGNYFFQLKGVQGEKTRYTNIIQTFIPRSLSGDATWPEIPSEFTQIEARIRELNEHPPYPGDNGFWMIWNTETDQYEQSELPAGGGSGGTTDYNALKNKPRINGVEIVGDVTTESLGIPDLSASVEAAAQSAQEAKDAATSAQESTSSAAASAQTAQQNAQTAQTAATTAEQHKTASQTAQTAAQDAQQAAETAKGQAEQFATQAQQSATQASESATAAQGHASTAQSAATAAQSSAEAAAVSAEEVKSVIPPTDTAKVGDVVTYDGEKAVWEPPSGGGFSSWKIIRDLTTSEDVDRVDISSDSDEQPFELNEIKLFTSTQSYEESASNFTVLLNGYWADNDPYIVSTHNSTASSENYQQRNDFTAFMNDGAVQIFEPWKPYPGVNSRSGSMWSIGEKYQSITSVSCVGKFKAGCRFILVGR